MIPSQSAVTQTAPSCAEKINAAFSQHLFCMHTSYLKCSHSLPLMSNSFQIMTLIVLESSSLLAADHTHLLQVFIFASWSSPPVTRRGGWAAHEADSSLQGFAPCMIYECPRTIPKSERGNIRSVGGVCFIYWPLCFAVVSVISLHKSRHVDYHRLLWNYGPEMPDSEHYTKLFCRAARALEWLFVWAREWDREQRASLKPSAFADEWFLLAKLYRIQAKKARDSRNTAALPPEVFNREKLASQCRDQIAHYNPGNWYSLSRTVGGMHAHLTSTHLTYLNTCAHTAADDVQMPYPRWKCMQHMSYWVADMLSACWLLMQMSNKCARQQPWGTNEWLQIAWLPKAFLLCIITMHDKLQRAAG